MTELDAERASSRVEDAVLDEQLAYYRARAPEYDRWFLREGRYDRGAEATAAWNRELGLVRGALAGLDLGGRRVLELAAGTGLWTEVLLGAGARVTVVDAAPEMLAALRARVGDAVEVIAADLFDWTPTGRYDAVVSCFFMSHVPDERFERFASLVAAALDDGGTAFLLDAQREATSTAADHVLPAAGSQTMRRRLDDGREFTIVKRFRDDASLAAAFARHGVDLRVVRTEHYFQYAVGRRAPRDAMS